MNMIAKVFVGLAVLFSGVASSAGVLDDLLATRLGNDAPITPGRWHLNFNKAKAYAEANGLPFIAVWSNDGCPHCEKLENNAMSEAFRSWMKDSGIVFYFACSRDSYPENTLGPSCIWTSGGDTGKLLPFVRIWWNVNGVTRADHITQGDTWDGLIGRYTGRNDIYDPENFVEPGDYDTFNPGGRYMINYLKTGPLAGWSYNPYSGGEFGCGNAATSPNAELELEYGTALSSITIPLTRTNANSRATTSLNYLLTTFPTGNAVTNVVNWAAGEGSKDVAVSFNPAWVKQVGNVSYATLQLFSDKVEVKYTNYVRFVDPVPNSPKNPLWIGERTKETLGWGEWTMDINAATSKVAAARAAGDDKAYTMLLIEGSIWCGDCANMERYVFNTDTFRTWAKEQNHLALVAIDVPRIKSGLAVPTLLSHAIYTKTDGSAISGSGYLTRHNVPLTGNGDVNAAKILERNIEYVKNSVGNGGFALGEYSSSRPVSQTGVPTIILLRADGSVAGRIYEFANSTRSLGEGSAAKIVRRLDELLAQDMDLTEEKNDTIRATTGAIGRRELSGIGATLSFSDQVDYYRIEADAYSTIRFNLVVTNGATSTGNIILSVLDGDDMTPVFVKTNSLSAGVSGECELPSDNCYIKVSYPLDVAGFPVDSKFSIDNPESTLVGYKITTDAVVYPSEILTLWEIAKDLEELAALGDAAKNVSITISEGQQYKFSGIDASDASITENFAYDSEKDVYTAKVTASSVQLKLEVNEAGGLSFGYQRWNPGMVEFYPVEPQSVKERGNDEESAFFYNINIRRTGGLSGSAGVVISLDTTKTTQLDSEWYRWENEGKELVWGEGTNDVVQVPVLILADEYADQVKRLVFKLTAIDDPKYTTPVNESAAEFVLNVVDDDVAVPGVLSLSATREKGESEQMIPENRVVVVKGGTEGFSLIGLRSEGTDGPVGARIYSNDTEIGTFSWIGRESGPKEIAIDIPAYEKDGGNMMRLRIDAVGESIIAPAAKYLTIKIVPESAVEFDEATKLVSDYVRYVKHSSFKIALNTSTYDAADEVSIVKIAGSLPPGLSWTEKDGNLEIGGVATRAGTYTATFQGVANDVPGGSTQVTIIVSDPSSPKDEYTEAVNPYLANARTLTDIMIVHRDYERLIGLLTVTVPKSGRLSAKYRPLEGDAVAMLSTAWDSVSEGDFTATLQGVDNENYTATVTACANGKINVTFADPNYPGLTTTIDRNTSWTAANPAETWRGYYTVSMPFKKQTDKDEAFASGDGFVTLRMTADAAVTAGRMAYAGMLANGKSFSGTSVLEATGKGSKGHEALLPIFCTGSDDLFSAILDIDPDVQCQEVMAYNEAYPYWKHVESVAGASYAGKLEVYGCLYNQSDIVSSCEVTFNTKYIFFYALPEYLMNNPAFEIQHDAAPVAWNTNNIYGIGMKVEQSADGGASIACYDPATCQREHGLTLNFNRETGVVSGSLWLDFYMTPTSGTRVNATYRGVVMPGWGAASSECGDCSLSSPKDHPFISGSCYFYDTFKYTSKWGQRKLSIKRGCPFSIGLEPGK